MSSNYEQRTVTIYDYPVNNLFEALTQLQKTKKMKKPFNPYYNFTKENHFEIIDKIELYRIANNLECTKISHGAGYAKCSYSNLKNNIGRFSEKSYNRFMALISTPVQKKESELTAQKCIDFLKATGEYKISKVQTITNWIEL